MLEETTANNCGCTRTCPKKSGVNVPFFIFVCVFTCVSRGCSNNLYLKYAGKPRHYQVRKTLPLLGSCVPTTPFHVLKLNQAKASTRKKVFHSLSLRRFLEILYPFTKRRQDEASVIGTGARTGAPQNEPRKGSFTRGSWKAWRSCAPS